MSKSVSVLDKYPQYEAVIGIEVHVQLTTATKIFCGSTNHACQDPNTNICYVCAGYPGVLPVLNRTVVEYAIRAGIATNCHIAAHSSFDRKHYFYPDLPKNYQITQAIEPICTQGYIEVRDEDGNNKKIRINRIHIEEDAGKNIHAQQSNESFVDLNRAGTPLLEIVSEPDISSSHEAKSYLKSLRSIVQYLGICSGNMEEGAFRADTNISVRKKGDSKLGTKCELKNINSFKFISDAVEHEIERQIELLQEGGRVRQETRLWDTKNKQTIVMRSKEVAADYRFFPDPDLPTIDLNESYIATLRSSMPELPNAKLERFCTKHGLSAYEAEILIDDQALADYFDQATRYTGSKQLINWILRDLIGYLNEHKLTLSACKVTPNKLAALIDLIETGKINNHAAKEIFAEVALNGADPVEIMQAQGLEQMGASSELEDLIKTIIEQHPQQTAEYRGGNQRLFGFFVGTAMGQTKGKGNPKIIQELLKKYLDS